MQRDQNQCILTLGIWLGGVLSRKPPMLVRAALANKLARIVWAFMAQIGVNQSLVTAT